MITKEFPNIPVHIDRMGSRSPFYVASLGMPIVGLNIPLAYALAKDIETTKKFLGSTIGVYAEHARQTHHKFKDAQNHEFLDAFVKDFAKHGWIYGVVLKENQSNIVEAVLKNKTEIDAFFEVSDAGYNLSKVSRTIFVPSEKFTRQNWKFEYNLKDLENIIDFKREELVK
jgi:hypothetical protein